MVARLRVLLPDDVKEVTATHVRFGREGGASYLSERPVQDMTEREFLCRLTGDLDELIRRFNRGTPFGLPEPRQQASRDRLVKEYLEPLLLGRAFTLAGKNGLKAGQAVGRDKLERGKGDWLETYSYLSQFLHGAAEGTERASVQDQSPAAGPSDSMAADVEAPAPEEPG
jgi:hypothetical protein